MGERQHSGIDEGVVHDDIGLGKACERMQSEQAGVARSCTGKPDVTWLEEREPGKSCAQTVGHAGHPSR
jgi:hypothetical protein